MTTRERLIIAAVVSAGLHALLISGAWLPVPGPPGERRPLEARLAPAAPVDEVARIQESRPEASHPSAPRPRRAAPPAAAAAPVVIAQAPTTPPVEPRAESPSAQAQAPSSQVSSELPEAAPSAGERSDPRPAAPAATPGPAPSRDGPPVVGAAETVLTNRPSGSLPRKGTITFALTFGGDGFSVGKAVQSWEVGSGSYKLASDAETTGIVDLFRPQRLRWLSKGTITRQGLRPESFLVSRTRRGQTEASEAQFNWNTGSLTYGVARERATAALPGDTQDIMSFIYQLALAPPAQGRYRLPITTGTKFETYEIEVRAEENIETPLGTMRTLPVRQRRRPGAESIEIWLAAQYHYLPVKIRYFDRDGNPAGEQVASDIRVTED